MQCKGQHHDDAPSVAHLSKDREIGQVEARDRSPDDIACRAEGVGTEKDPQERHYDKCQQPRCETHPPGVGQCLEPRHEPLVQTQRPPVPGSPEDELPCRPVPQPADEHCGHEVKILPALATTVAAQRDIDIVAQPERQRHVPAPPELGDVEREVGKVEVLGQTEPHD